jgi:hypothetical protein
MHGKGWKPEGSCSISDVPEFDPWPTSISVDEKLKESAEIMLPSSIMGFEIEEKKWGKFTWNSSLASY